MHLLNLAHSPPGPGVLVTVTLSLRTRERCDSARVCTLLTRPNAVLTLGPAVLAGETGNKRTESKDSEGLTASQHRSPTVRNHCQLAAPPRARTGVPLQWVSPRLRC
jgi:hypothetical protein